MTYVAHLAGRDEFVASRVRWDSLALQMAVPSIFSTWEWAEVCWRCGGRWGEPAIILVLRDGELVGILPLAFVPARRWLYGRVLDHIGSALCPDHVDLVTSAEDAPGCIRAIRSYFESGSLAWDVLSIGGLIEESHLATHCPGSKRVVSAARYINISQGFEEYERRLSGNRRNTLRRKARKLRERGISFSTVDASEQIMETLFSLHARRWATKGRRSAFDDPEVHAFHRAFVGLIASRGWVLFGRLGDDERTIGVIYGFLYGGRLLYYQIGIDPDWESFSPGSVLYYEFIHEAATRGCREFDFLRGDEPFKSDWTPVARHLLDLRMYNHTPAGGISFAATASRHALRRLRTAMRSGSKTPP